MDEEPIARPARRLRTAARLAQGVEPPPPQGDRVAPVPALLRRLKRLRRTEARLVSRIRLLEIIVLLAAHFARGAEHASTCTGERAPGQGCPCGLADLLRATEGWP